MFAEFGKLQLYTFICKFDNLVMCRMNCHCKTGNQEKKYLMWLLL